MNSVAEPKIVLSGSGEMDRATNSCGANQDIDEVGKVKAMKEEIWWCSRLLVGKNELKTNQRIADLETWASFFVMDWNPC